MDTEQIFQAILQLSVPDRLRLVERVVHNLTEESAAPRSTVDPSSLIGLFADEPDLVDDVCRMAMEARRRDPLRTEASSEVAGRI